MKKQDNNWQVFFTQEVIQEFAKLTDCTFLEARHFLYKSLPSKIQYPAFVAAFIRWKTMDESQQAAMSIDFMEYYAGDFMAIMDILSAKFMSGDFAK